MSLKESTSSIIAAAFNIPIIAMFTYALLFPEQNTEFIFGFGVLIFLLELMNISSSGFALGPKAGLAYVVLLFYAVFIGMFGFIFGNWAAIGLFVASMVGRFIQGIGRKNIDRKKIGNEIGKQIFIFLISVFVIIFLAPLWEIIFPFSAEVLAEKLPRSSGLFVEIPQTLLVWGISYYSLMTILDLRKAILCWKKK